MAQRVSDFDFVVVVSVMGDCVSFATQPMQRHACDQDRMAEVAFHGVRLMFVAG